MKMMKIKDFNIVENAQCICKRKCYIEKVDIQSLTPLIINTTSIHFNCFTDDTGELLSYPS